MVDDIASSKKSQAKSAIATKRMRDAKGHFIKPGTHPETSHHNKSHGVMHIEENKTANDETLVDVKVTNPLRKITGILEQIKRRQATVIDLKFTIPLVALPIFMLVAFSLGKAANPVCGDNTQTRIGLLYTLKSTSPIGENNFWDTTKQALFTSLPFLNSFANKQVTVNRTILIQRDNTALSLSNPNNVGLTSYHARQVFVTGKVNSCENTLEVQSSDDVQLLP